MVTTVLGHRGMLGSVVERRLREYGEDVRTTDQIYAGEDDFVLWAADADYVIDCVRGGFVENALLPLHLSQVCRVIVPSTDAIREDTPYARSKRIAEQAHGVVIRAGIIDLRHQPTVGYRNWFCNPLTPLEWIDLAWSLRDSPGLHATGREPTHRLAIADAVARVWDRPAPAPALGPPNDRLQPVGTFVPLVDALGDWRAWQ